MKGKFKCRIFLLTVALVAAGILYTISFRFQSEDDTIVQKLASSEEVSMNRSNVESDEDKENHQESSVDISTPTPVNQVQQTEPSQTAEGKVFTQETEDLPDVVDSNQARLEEAANIYVHLCGAVKNSGVYEVKQGSRLIDVVELAGGMKEDAAKDYVNLAQEVFDGQQVVIPDQEEAAKIDREEYIQQTDAKNPLKDETSSVTKDESRDDKITKSDSANTAGERININTATKEELMTLSGIGEAKADLIINYREDVGGFQKIEDIMKIRGIKEGLFQKICDHITTGTRN